MTIRRAAVGLAVLFAFMSVAQAAVVTFSGVDVGVATNLGPNAIAARNSFQTATGLSSPSVTFESLSLGPFTSRALDGSITATLTGMDAVSGGIVNTSGAQLGYNTTTAGSTFLQLFPAGFGGVTTASFSFGIPIHAFGAFFTGVQSAVGTTTVTFNDGSTQTFTLANTGSPTSGVQFWGFTSTASIVQVDVVTTSQPSVREIYGIDDIYYATDSMPEPASYLLMTGGLLALGLWRLRRSS